MTHRALIIGSGRIALRHAANLRLLFPGVELSLLRSEGARILPESWSALSPRIFSTLEEALRWKPDLLLSCGPSSTRLEQVKPFLPGVKRIFLEKPVSTNSQGIGEFFDQSLARGVVVQIGYNLRETEAFQRINRELADPAWGNLQFISAEVGQYLPDWRPAMDYRKTVSAQKQLGGGALLELSHELDYTLATCGTIKTVLGLRTKRSDLDLDVEDVAKIIYQDTNGVLAGIHLDFCRRDPKRTCQWSLQNGTIQWDLLEGILKVYRPDSGWETLLEKKADIAESYLKSLRILMQGDAELTRFNQERSLKIFGVIDAIQS